MNFAFDCGSCVGLTKHSCHIISHSAFCEVKLVQCYHYCLVPLWFESLLLMALLIPSL